MKILSKFQLGKNGLTEGALQSLSQDLKYHKQVRISVLKSCCRNREELKQIAEEIIKKVPAKCGYRIIGFTIVLTKKRK